VLLQKSHPNMQSVNHKGVHNPETSSCPFSGDIKVISKSIRHPHAIFNPTSVLLIL